MLRTLNDPTLRHQADEGPAASEQRESSPRLLYALASPDIGASNGSWPFAGSLCKAPKPVRSSPQEVSVQEEEEEEANFFHFLQSIILRPC